MRTATLLVFALLTTAPLASAILEETAEDALEGVLESAQGLLSGDGVAYNVGFHEMIDTSEGSYAGERITGHDEALRFVTVLVRDPEAFEARARMDDNVRYVEEDGVMSAFYTPNDPFWSTSDYQWGAKQIRADLAWDKHRGRTSVKLCIIDSGLYKGHEEFTGLSRILQGYDFAFNDNDPNDPNGHGTHVTGIASAQMNNGKGMAGMAMTSILPIRVLDGAGSGSFSNIAKGIRYCRDQGGHISSMSLGGGHSTTVQDAVKYAAAGGVLQIAAVGNDGCACVRYPAGYGEVMGVAATTKSNGKASFSNTGSFVEISAPGVSIVSAYKNINGCSSGKCYVYLDGTSMATPYVSGTAALVKSYNTGLSGSQIRNRLTSTAQDLGASGWDSSFGYGLVRADRAVF